VVAMIIPAPVRVRRGARRSIGSCGAGAALYIGAMQATITIAQAPWSVNACRGATTSSS